MKKYIGRRKEIIFLVLVLALAAVFRIYQIQTVPPGLYPDEAINGNDALTSLQTNTFKVFYPENNGREGLFIWLVAFSFRLFGAAPWSIRLVSAFFGILTILALYLLVRELFDKQIALISSFFLAVSAWHTNFSRIGFRAILVPFLMCLSLYLLFRAFRTKNLWAFAASGLIFGLGFYTYIAFRMAVLILGVLLVLKFIEGRRDWLKVAAFLAAITIIALPIGLYFLSHPADFVGRASGVSIFSADSPIKALAVSSVKTLGMFNIVGDYNWRHNYSGAPALNWLVGLLFLIGLIAAVRNVRAGCHISLLVLVWWLVMLLPAILTVEGLPHALRTLGAAPPAYILAALGLTALLRQSKKLTPVILTACLLIPAASNFHQYFITWGWHEETAKAFRQDLVQLGNYLNNISGRKYVIANGGGVLVPFPDGLPMPAQTIMFINRAPTTYLKDSELGEIGRPAIVIPLVDTGEIAQYLNNKWPNQVTTEWFHQFKVYAID